MFNSVLGLIPRGLCVRLCSWLDSSRTLCSTQGTELLLDGREPRELCPLAISRAVASVSASWAVMLSWLRVVVAARDTPWLEIIHYSVVCVCLHLWVGCVFLRACRARSQSDASRTHSSQHSSALGSYSVWAMSCYKTRN